MTTKSRANKYVCVDLSRIFFIKSSAIVYCRMYSRLNAFIFPQDEVVAVKDAESPKGRIVIRAEDFFTWLVNDLKWSWGLVASYNEKRSSTYLARSNGIPSTSLLSNSTKLDLSEVEKEKGLLKDSFYFKFSSILFIMTLNTK